uniref:putative group II intron reverse transcriptase/maturase mat5 n=1 Tax=Phacus arnoldii TaxID=298292 RepID=UPI0023AB4122|nr:putative group II intron reverse transcriptase/maturase mat5 [Phacus arnoldii]WCH63577.1 putative group II intron reverse transcriptase/maturase mat5 [Phacus arnoldii]
MIISKLRVLKSKKILLPGLDLKDIKPLTQLLRPSYLLIPMFFVSNIAQVMDNLKGILTPKEVQQIFSVKVYSKVLSCGLSSINISVIQSIAKTLGPELETISILNVKERIFFLTKIQKKLVSLKGIARICPKNNLLNDPLVLLRHRRGLAVQCRSIMISTPIFSPHSIVLGVSIKEINIGLILESCKLLWTLLGLETEEFDFILYKEANCIFKKLFLDKIFNPPVNKEDCLKILIYAELIQNIEFSSHLKFLEDEIVLKGENNLTLLEKELGFIERPIPSLPLDFHISSNLPTDTILRAAIEQRKSQKFNIESIFKRAEKSFQFN